MPVLYHFVNNLLSVSALLGVGSLSEQYTEELSAVGEISRTQMFMSLGMFISLCAASPFLLYYGRRLLTQKSELTPVPRRHNIICAVIAAVLFITGAIIFIPNFVAVLVEIL